MSSTYEIVNRQKNVEIFGIRLKELVEAKLISDGVELSCLIAIHNTSLGPSLGGLRFDSYEDFKEKAEELGLAIKSPLHYAVWDVARLAEGMTKKAAVHDLELGGGKAVIIGDPNKDKSEKLFREFGRLVNSLKGKYITAEDSGTNTEDMEIIAKETPYVVGLNSYNGLIGSGDPGPFTAYGVSRAIEAAVPYRFKNQDLRDRVLSVQGIGNVGFPLIFGFPKDEKFDSVRFLFTPLIERFKKIIISDTDPKKIARAEEEAIELGLYSKLKFVEHNAILTQKTDIYAPCLRQGGILDERNIHLLYENGCKIIAGATNHQLAREEDGELLHNLRILYIRDYVANGGGLTNVYLEWLSRQKNENYSVKSAVDRVGFIFYTVKDLLERSTQENKSTTRIANQIAEEKIKAKKSKLQKVVA